MKKTIRIIWVVIYILVLICFGIMVYYLARGEALPKSLMVTFLVMLFLESMIGAIYPIKLKEMSKKFKLFILISVLLVAILMFIIVIS